MGSTLEERCRMPSFAFVKCTVTDVGATDYLIVKYLRQYFKKTFLIARYDAKYYDPEINLISLPFKPISVPFLRGFISIFVNTVISFLRLVLLKPKVVLWEWGCVFFGAFLYRILFPRSIVVIDIRSVSYTHLTLPTN